MIVSTIGRPGPLLRLIESLAGEAAAGVTIELIVVDQSPDHSCQPVVAAASDIVDNLTAIYLQSPRGVSRGRNVGMAAATGRLVMFPDDDAWFSGDTLARAVEHLARHPEHDGYCTQLQNGFGEPSMLRWSNKAQIVTPRNHHRTSIGSTMLFRAAAARAAGGFNESIGPGADGWFGSCEDADFLLRVAAQGHRIWYDPTAVVNHRDSRYDGGPRAERKALVYGCGQGWLWKRHPFPTWLIIGVAVRRIVGGWLWSLQGRPDIGRAHRAWVRGAINGLLGRQPIDLVEPTVDEPGEARPPTEAEFGRSFSWRLVLAPLGTAATFGLTGIATRTMEPADVTILYAVLAALMIGPILGRFGLNQWAVRDLAAMRTSQDPATVAGLARRFAATAVLPAVLTAPLVAGIAIIASAQNRSVGALVILTSIVLAAESWRLTASDTLIGLGFTGWSAALAHQVRAIAVTVLIVVYLLTSSAGLDIVRLLQVMSVVGVALVAVGLYRIWRIPSRSDPDLSVDVWAAARIGLPFLLVDLVVVIVARGDVWLAASVFDADQAALYGTASVLAAQIGLPIGLASIALAPVIAGNVARGRVDQIERSIRTLATAILYIVAPATVIAVLFGRRLLELGYGSPYGDAHPYLLILLVGNLALALLGAAPVVLLMAHCHRHAMNVCVTWLAIVVPVVIGAAVMAGPVGLAIASALATVGLYSALAATAWVATGVPMLPYLNPSRLDIDKAIHRLLPGQAKRPAPSEELIS